MKKGAEYRKTQMGENVQFDVVPAPKPKYVGLYFILSAVGLLIFFVTLSNGLPGLAFICAILTALVIFIFSKTGPQNKFRTATSFKAGPDGIFLDNTLIPSGDIHRLILRNHVFGDSVDNSFTNISVHVGQPSMGQAMSEINSMMALSWKKKVARVSFRLEVEAGGKAKMLACGMDETTANGLMADVARIVGIR